MHHFRRLHHFRTYAVLHFASFFVNLSKIDHFQLVNLAHSKLMIVVDSRSCDVEKVHKRLKQFPDFFSVDFWSRLFDIESTRSLVSPWNTKRKSKGN